MTKAKIVQHTETTTVTKEVTRTFPVWSWDKGSQLIRFNKESNIFEVTQPAWDAGEWQPLEWRDWIDASNIGITKRQVTETLENLLALIKATK